MTSHQQAVYEILLQFSRLCQRHGLTYYLCGGTLLGAIRHKGFIPWDDDIDVMMPTEDYLKFIELAPRTLPAGYVLQCSSTEDQFPFLFAKVCNSAIPFDNGMVYRPAGIFIDVFPVSYCKTPTKLRRILFDANLLITHILMAKCGWSKPYRYENKVIRLGSALLHRCSSKLLKAVRRFLLSRICSAAPTPYLCSVAGIYKARTEMFPSAWLDKSVSVTFEGSEQPAPAQWDVYLTHFYGDYMTPPPEEKRINHMG